MNDITQIAVIVRGKVIDSHLCKSVIEAERYKAAVRQWGRENGVVVSVMTTVPACPQEERHWLLPAQAS
jgi:hypothetical protein